MASLSELTSTGYDPKTLTMAEADGSMDERRYQVGPLDILVPARTTPGHLSPVLLGGRVSGAAGLQLYTKTISSTVRRDLVQQSLKVVFDEITKRSGEK